MKKTLLHFYNSLIEYQKNFCKNVHLNWYLIILKDSFSFCHDLFV